MPRKAPRCEFCAKGEADQRAEGIGGNHADKIEPGNGRFESRGQDRCVRGRSNLRENVRAEEGQTAQIGPIAGPGNHMISGQHAAYAGAIDEREVGAAVALLGLRNGDSGMQGHVAD